MDDSFAEDELPKLLRFMRDAMRAFEQDHKLVMSPAKCKLHMKGVSIDTAHDLVKQCIEADNDLECLRPFLVRHEDPAQDVIQVDGIRVAGVPLGSPEFVTRYVESKRDDILHDLPKLDVVSDDLVHAHMMTYCQHPRFGFLGRNLPPAALLAQAPDAVSPLTEVHQAILKALLNRGTANAFQEWQDDVQQYCAHVLERPPHKGGHGITPLQESSTSGFYSATARFISWLAKLEHKAHWLPGGQDLQDPSTWTNSRLIALKQVHQELITQHGCREWAPPPPAAGDAANPADALANDANNPAPAAGAQPNPVPINVHDGQPVPNAPEAQNGQPGDPDDALARAVVPSLPPLNLLATIQASPQGADDDDNDDEHRQARPKHVLQKALTKHIMSRKHVQAPEAPWTRGRQMLELRQAQTIPTIGPVEGPGVNDPSILQSVMPHQVADEEAAAGAAAGAGAGGGAAADAGAGAGAGAGADANANPGAGVGGGGNAPKRHMLTHSPAGCTLAGPMHLTWNRLRLGQVEYQAWFCQQLGLEPPCLARYAGQHCSCGRFTIDADHLHTCHQHSGNWYAAHEHILTVVEEIVRAAGFRTKRRYVATSRGRRRGDLEIRDANVADKAHLIIDVAMVHAFHGACDDIGRHGALRHAQNPDRALIDAAKRKVKDYRLDYLQDGKAFLPLIASTSGRLHGEFVRFLYFLAHKRAMDFFAAIGQAHPSHNELCQQRGAFFYQHRSRVGVACAQASALRIGAAAPPRRQALLQGANANALQEDLAVNWGG